MVFNSKSIYKFDLEFNEKIPMHDWYLTIQILLKNLRYDFINKNLSKYRQHDNNILGSTNNNIFKIIIKAFKHGDNVININSLFYDSNKINFKFYINIIINSFKIRPFSKLIYVFFSI